MNKKNIVFNNGKFYKKTENDFFSSYKELDPKDVNVSEEEISVTWKGPLIPFSLWRALVAWCEVTQNKFKSEALAFLYLDDKEGWKIWYPPQITNGMTVEVDQESKQYAPQRKLLGDALQMGTLHHHCTSSAFASGTDKADEIDRDGLHFTIGNLNKDEYDIHMRICVNNTCWDCDPADFIEASEELKHVPEKFKKQLHEQLITEATGPNVLKEWEKSFKEPLKNVRKPNHTSNNKRLSSRIGSGLNYGQQGYIWDHEEWENEHLPANSKPVGQCTLLELVDELITDGCISMITELDWDNLPTKDVHDRYYRANPGSVDEVKAFLLAMELSPWGMRKAVWEEVREYADISDSITANTLRETFEQWIKAQQ